MCVRMKRGLLATGISDGGQVGTGELLEGQVAGWAGAPGSGGSTNAPYL